MAAQRLTLDDGPKVTPELVKQIIDEELTTIRTSLGKAFDEGLFKQAKELFIEVALDRDYVDFLTLPAYERMP